MCASDVYLIDRDGKESLVFENVDKVMPTENGVILKDIFYQSKEFKAKIKELALVAHRIVLEEIV